MTTEPKPYTLAEWRARLSPNIFEMIQEELRERGLIAEEPVNPLLEKAVELVDLWLPDETELRHEAIDLALAALRRGMELGRSDCSEALAPRKELTLGRLEYLMATTLDDGRFSKGDAARLHAAVTEALQ